MKESYNPFVHIPSWLRGSVIIYFLIYTFISGTFQLAIEPGLTFELIVLVLLRILTEFIILIPLFFFKRIGLLHLLVFPYLLSLIKKFVENPGLMLAPFNTEGVYLETTVLAN